MLHLVVLVFLYTIQVKSESCTTPNNEQIECISLYSCPTFLQALQTQDSASIDFVTKSRCGKWNMEPLVCCGSTTNFTQNEQKTPPPWTCGAHTINPFRPGNEASIDEFPWLALMIYEQDPELSEEIANERSFRKIGCAGSLFNARYVLTAAHCLRTLVATAVGVRLGEYNIKQNEDCVLHLNYQPCSNPVEDIGIEEKIVHPQYNRRLGINDIALIRLNRTVTFSDYIRPICLPTSTTMLAKAGDVLTTTGFGRITEDRDFATIKKRIKVGMITNKECAHVYENADERNGSVTDNVICTRDLLDNVIHSCEGDSGAPVMFSYQSQLYMEGILSWGTASCGPRYPYVHVKVANYLNWIEANIRS